ncbi:MAG TPA: hypothetical protein VNC60_00305, partial [Actinomycetota bacterium]|nr:hypothetical protein [Actinomycetota bacterium]
PGDRFVVAWPRGSMRRGAAPVGREIVSGSVSVTIEHVECATDSVRVTYQAPTRAGLALSIDDVTLSQIDDDYDADTGRGRVRTYPAPKSHSRMAITARGAEQALEITLP